MAVASDDCGEREMRNIIENLPQETDEQKEDNRQEQAVPRACGVLTTSIPAEDRAATNLNTGECTPGQWYLCVRHVNDPIRCQWRQLGYMIPS